MLHYSSWQCWILNLLSGARDWTHILIDTSQVCYRWAMMGIPHYFYYSLFSWVENSVGISLDVMHWYFAFSLIFTVKLKFKGNKILSPLRRNAKIYYSHYIWNLTFVRKYTRLWLCGLVYISPLRIKKDYICLLKAFWPFALACCFLDGFRCWFLMANRTSI